MVFISKLFTALLLPPGCIILGLLLITLFIPRRYKIITGLMTAFLYFLSIQPVSDSLLRPLEDVYPPLSVDEDDPQAIVVLGGGTIQNSPEAGKGQDTLGSDALKRAIYAFSLRDDFPVPYIFSGGRVFDYGQEPEAITAGRVFTSLGLPSDEIIFETTSRHTWENAKETAKLGFERIILVTSAYHMPRSVYCFEQNGISVIPAPTDYKCARGRKYSFLSFMPSMNSLYVTYLALHEYTGLFVYRFGAWRRSGS
jgi:uncharacterized SAM-binding protein YcdF (DUF218 family)